MDQLLHWLDLIGVFVFRFFFRRWKKTDKGRESVDKMKLKVPVFGVIFQKVALSRYASTAAMLLR